MNRLRRDIYSQIRKSSTIIFLFAGFLVFTGSAYFLTRETDVESNGAPKNAAINKKSQPSLLEDIPMSGGEEYHGTIRIGVTFRGALLESGITEPLADTIQNHLETAGFNFRSCKPSQIFVAQADSSGLLQTFMYQIDRLSSYWIRRDQNGYLNTEIYATPVTEEVVSVDGSIESSVYHSILALGEKPDLVAAYADILGYDVDFVFEPRQGDTFSILVEKQSVGDEFIGYGKILAAEFIGEITGKVIGYRFEDSLSGSRGWYAPDGTNLQRMFMRSPLSILRVTSAFGMRKHPISGRRKMHTGTDYGAPTGTPVWSIATGKVSYAGYNGGYGNLIEVSHPGNIKTRYGHLSRILVKKGQTVRQQQVIGRVGSTGYSTGHHLHFEYLVNGMQTSPRKVKNPPLRRIPEKYMSAFSNEMLRIDKLWNEARQITKKQTLARSASSPNTHTSFSD